jgi:phage tail-like protein
MTSLRLLPPVARPPHDPLWLTLNAAQGWRAGVLDDTVLTHPDTSLTLKISTGSRSLLEPSGSFGGLVPPATVANGADGEVFLLQSVDSRLLKYDPCSCTFIQVPYLGGKGSEARQLLDPSAITVANGNLYITDSGNARVSVFSLREYILRGFLRPPQNAELPNPWKPVSVTSDRWGRIFVADPNNGSIHRFSRRGVWQTRFANLGAVKFITTDREGRLYVIIDGETDVRVLNGDGVLLERVSDVSVIAERFDPLPFHVTADGTLIFDDACHAFDTEGQPTDVPAPVTIKYAERGMYISQALDSAIHRCQWHSVTLTGEIPSATSVVIRTYTAEVELPTDILLDLPEDAWDVHPIARNVSGDWDCLILSKGGRYLWLRLDLIGGGTVAPRLDSVRVEFPRISLRRYLPAVFGEDPVASDFTDRFLSIFDKTFREIESHIDHQARLFDPRSTPATSTGGKVDFLAWIASWIGLTIDRRWPEERRREFVRLASQLYDLRGTREGLWRLLLLYLGMDQPKNECNCEAESTTCATCHPSPRCGGRPLNCAPPPAQRARELPPLILEHFQLRRWLFVGSGRLGDQAVLWGRRIVNRSQLDSGAQIGDAASGGSQLIGAQDPYRDPFHVYASRFTVFVPACVGRSAQQRKGLETLLRTESPAHTQYNIEYVEPKFRIGVQSMIGFDAVIGRYPSDGVKVGTSTLGNASVLSEGRDGANSQGRQVPSMRIGSHTRIGATTRLD